MPGVTTNPGVLVGDNTNKGENFGSLIVIFHSSPFYRHLPGICLPSPKNLI
jgi:hypothetical protein